MTMADISHDDCKQLLDRLGYEYGLDGMILDMTNGWVLRDRQGFPVAAGGERVPGTLCDRALAIQQTQRRS